jgi:hypothetical protein
LKEYYSFILLFFLSDESTSESAACPFISPTFAKVKHFVFLDSLKISNSGSLIQLTETFSSHHSYTKLWWPFFQQQATNSKTLLMTDRLKLLAAKLSELFSYKCHKLALITKYMEWTL